MLMFRSSPPVQNLNQNPRTLLPKFYGLYCVQSGGKNIRVCVMNNILPRVVSMHLKYDLKGSTYKRRASKKEREKSKPTYKDLDFMQDSQDGLMLDTDTYSALVKTLQRDCLVSYSLCLHFPHTSHQSHSFTFPHTSHQSHSFTFPHKSHQSHSFTYFPHI